MPAPKKQIKSSIDLFLLAKLVMIFSTSNSDKPLLMFNSLFNFKLSGISLNKSSIDFTEIKSSI